MNSEKLQYGRLTVDKYLDIRYCDEVIFEYLGSNTYKAITNYIHEDYVEPFRQIFEQVGTEWASLLLKIKHLSGEYRDVYLKIRKQNNPVKGIQLWDIYVYDIDILVLAYHEQLLVSNSYKLLTGLAEINYFKFEHDTNVISFCRILKSREVTLFSMDLDQWSQEAFSLGHIDEVDKAAFTNFYLDIKMGKKDISATLGSSLTYDTEEIHPCRFQATTVHKEGIPWRTIGHITSLSTARSASPGESSIDPLTGLYSKKAIADQAAILLNETKGNAALFILDVDNFKTANDSFGHQFGDQVLAKVADVIADVIGENGIAGRFGGDEFMGVITNYADRDELKGKLRSIRSRIEFLFANVPELGITCSIGACEREENIRDYNTLFAYADKCLYIAKDKGKNRYIVYLKHLHGELVLDDGKISDIKTTSRAVNILSVVNDCILTLHQKGYDGLEAVMQQFLNVLDFDRVSIYYGDGYPRILCREKVPSTCDHAFFAHNRDYLSGFSSEGVLAYASIHRLQEMDLNIYHIYNSQRTENFVQFILGTKDNIKGFLSLECCHLEKKRSENVINYLNIVAHMIGTVLEEKDA